ncbi:MAG: thrombospondin type 3 repeat-containing protein [Acidobacteriota bacterium]|nr:MAG: thrombospondin type 3 repeat-containing protein [Acidobacteriota bacterium]
MIPEITGPCTDGDGDEVQDGIDNRPSAANADQADFDTDRVGDLCDADDDNDGIDDGADCRPFNASIWSEPMPASDVSWNTKTELAWTSDSQATTSNVYRGTLGPEFHGDSACDNADVSGDVSEQPEEPPLGEGFHYLVSGENECGESGLGSDSKGDPWAFEACP